MKHCNFKQGNIMTTCSLFLITVPQQYEDNVLEKLLL